MLRSIAAISGASGFVGKHLTKALEAQNIVVEYIPRDMLYDALSLTSFLESLKPTYLFHLAAYGNMHHQTDITEIINANILRTVALLTASLAIPYRAFINVSSSSVLLPHETFYSASKAASEKLAKAFQLEFNKPIISVRPYSLYGIGEAPYRFIPTVFRSCLQHEPIQLASDASHDWTDVDEFCQFLIHIAKNAQTVKGLTIGFGTGKATSNAKVVSLIERICGSKANIISYQQLRKFDHAGWKANPADDYIGKISLEEGLTKYYAHYQQTVKA